MMRKWNRMMSALMAGALLAGGNVALAHGPGMDDGDRMMEKRMQHMGRHLDLTDAQRQEMRAIMEASAPQMRELREQIREKRARLFELSTTETFDEQAVQTEAQELGALTAQMAELAARSGSQANQVLTPEQRAKVKEHRRQGSGHRHMQD